MYLLVVWHSKCTLVLLISAIGGFCSPLWRLWATEWIEATLLTELQVTPLSVDMYTFQIHKSLKKIEKYCDFANLYLFMYLAIRFFSQSMKRCNSKAGSSSHFPCTTTWFSAAWKALCKMVAWLRLIPPPWKAERPHFGDSTPPPVDVAPAPRSPRLQLRGASVEVLEAWKNLGINDAQETTFAVAAQ